MCTEESHFDSMGHIRDVSQTQIVEVPVCVKEMSYVPWNVIANWYSLLTRPVRLTWKYLVVATIENSCNYEFCLSLGDFLFEKVRLGKTLKII